MKSWIIKTKNGLLVLERNCTRSEAFERAFDRFGLIHSTKPAGASA